MADGNFGAKTLKECANFRMLTEMIVGIKAQSEQDYLVMVVDNESVRFLSAALSMFSVTQQGVMVIEKLELERKIMTDRDALYFLTPSNDCISKLVKDFKDKRQYRFAHVVWTGNLNDRQMDYIANSDMIPFIKTFKIAHFEFLLADPDVFHFDMNTVLNELYVEKQADAIETAATRLAQVCGVLHELPFICYRDSSPITSRLALATQQRVDLLFGSIPSLTTTNPRALLVVLDRNYDLAAPLMHDTHYETLVYDLLKVADDNSVEYTALDGSGEQKRRKAVLDDRDQLWMEMKGKDIDEAVDALGETFQKFAQGHSDIQAVQASHARISNAQQMAQIVKALPQYQEMLAKYSAHMNIAEACMDEFLKTTVQDCTVLEQKIMTGLAPDGSEVKVGVVLDSLIRQLDALTSDEQRLRLILLYWSCYEVSELDRRKLFSALKPPEIQAVQNLKHFGLTVQGDGRKTVSRASNRTSREAKARIKASEKMYGYAQPELADTLRKLLAGDYTDFQFTKESPEEAAEPEKPNVPKSLRRPKAASFVNSGRGEGRGRLIIFVVGGLSYAERRAAQSAAASTNTKIIIGGTNLVRPDDFATQIMSMHGRGLQSGGVGITEVRIDLS